MTGAVFGTAMLPFTLAAPALALVRLPARPFVRCTRATLPRAVPHPCPHTRIRLLTQDPCFRIKHVQVDEHGSLLLGEGRGLPLGFDDTMVAMHTFGMFFTIWALWAVSARNFGGGTAEEDGLSL